MIYYFAHVHTCPHLHVRVCECACVYRVRVSRFVIYGLRLRFAIAQSSGKLTEAIAILSALKLRLCVRVCVWFCMCACACPWACLHWIINEEAQPESSHTKPLFASWAVVAVALLAYSFSLLRTPHSHSHSDRGGALLFLCFIFRLLS